MIFKDRLSSIINPVISKVPEATVIFWIAKILTTGMGETTSDFFVKIMNPAIAIGLAGIVLAIALIMQFKSKSYVPWRYWFTVIMVSVFGTMAADVLHVGLGIPYVVSTVFFFAMLLIIFIVWYANEKTLSIHSIYTRRRETFYWLTILTTFALGTAVGDMTATTLHLGYFSSGMLFAALILIPALAYWWFDLNEVLAFWVAYILTRPLGASFADWAGVSTARGGLNWGTGPVSLVLFVIICCLVGYLTVSHEDLPKS
jgi:uncharacterized membrane-anchored protein